MKYCDLHCHSNYSDGSCSPEELVNMACSLGLGAIALTDHNTLDGLECFYQAAKGRIAACGGCEFSTEAEGQELHLLGLFLDPTNCDELKNALNIQLQNEDESNRQTLERLANAGFDVSYDEFVDLFEVRAKNRAHIARYLLKKGIVSQVQEAFKELLSRDGSFYKESEKLNFYEMISLIHKVGGVAVWAHPLMQVDYSACEKIVQKAIDYGLDGIEVYYSKYTDKDINFMRQLSKKYHLIESGGSDFHGESKPDIHIGIGRGNLHIPINCYETLRQRALEKTRG